MFADSAKIPDSGHRTAFSQFCCRRIEFRFAIYFFCFAALAALAASAASFNSWFT